MKAKQALLNIEADKILSHAPLISIVAIYTETQRDCAVPQGR